MKRRHFLQLGFGGIGIIASGLPFAKAVAASCGLATPQQTEGPFYPTLGQRQTQIDQDADLTFVKGHRGNAVGQIVLLSGQVIDQSCNPVPKALVEIWQACASGRYNHPQDPNTAPLDANFQYWGRAITDTSGQYKFKTIKPGAYPADTDWMRPPHIHFKVTKLGYHELTSQLYFAGDRYNEEDKILQAVPSKLRDKVVIEFKETPTAELIGQFDITLMRA